MGRSEQKGSMNENSELASSKGWCSLDCEIDDSDVGDVGKDEVFSGVVIVDSVMVSARGRGTKRPRTLG